MKWPTVENERLLSSSRADIKRNWIDGVSGGKDMWWIPEGIVEERRRQ